MALIQFKIRLASYALRRRTWVNVLLPADFIKFAKAPRFVRILSVIGPFPPLVPVREYFGAFDANNRQKRVARAVGASRSASRLNGSSSLGISSGVNL